jgi:hypothetical protein
VLTSDFHSGSYGDARVARFLTTKVEFVLQHFSVIKSRYVETKGDDDEISNSYGVKNVKISFYRAMTTCSFASGYLYFGGIKYRHLLGENAVKMETAGSS